MKICGKKFLSGDAASSVAARKEGCDLTQIVTGLLATRLEVSVMKRSFGFQERVYFAIFAIYCGQLDAAPCKSPISREIRCESPWVGKDSPKEAVFGGQKRARISSQRLKWSIRRSDVFKEQFDGLFGTRTRGLPELVKERRVTAGISEELASIAAQETSAFGTEDGKKQTANKSGHYRTAQTMFLSDAEVSKNSARAEILYHSLHLCESLQRNITK